MAVTVYQALVLVGGKATRLRSSGIEVPISKSFMQVAGHPLLYWNLISLHQAGVRSLVIAGDETCSLRAASRVLKTLPCRFMDIVYFHDFGRGVHGLPYEARYLLDEVFIFECGHGISRASHYQALARMKNLQNVVFSAFKPHPKNRRQPVSLNGRVAIPGSSPDSTYALAHPILADRAYARLLLERKFRISDILTYYAAQGQLHYVKNDMPPEYDIPEEMTGAHTIYEQYLADAAIMQ